MSNAFAKFRMIEESHACETSSPSVTVACARNLASFPGYASANEASDSLNSDCL